MPQRCLAALAVLCLAAAACTGNPMLPRDIPLPTVFVPPTSGPATAAPAPPTSGPTPTLLAQMDLAAGQVKLWDIAVDGVNAYWTTCGTDPYAQDGAVLLVPKAGGTPMALVSGQVCPTDIALDGQNVYWLAGSFESGYSVWRVAKAGGEPARLAAGHDIRSVAVDESGVYWSDCQTSTDDCSILRLAAGGAEPVRLASGLAYPDALALDDLAVYWVNGSTTIMRVAKEAVDGAPAVLASTQFYPQALAVDATYVYWIGLDYVFQVDKTTGARVVLASGQTPSDIAVDETHVYWTNYGGRVLRSVKGGGRVELIAADAEGGKNLALDEQSIFWSNFDAGTLTRTAKSGGPPVTAAAASGAVTLAAAQERLTGLVAGPAGIAWSLCGTEAANYLDGAVIWAPAGGVQPITLAVGQSCPSVIGAGPEGVYWYSGQSFDARLGDILRAGWEGGEPATIVSGLTNVTDFAVDGSNVYWSTCGTPEQAFSDAAILAVPTAGGEAAALARDCGLLALDGGELYWSNANGLFRLVAAGGQSQIIGPGGADLITDATSIYFTAFQSTSESTFHSCADEGSSLMRLSKEGGEPIALATLEGGSLGLAAGAASLYWATDCSQGIVRVPKDGGEPVMLAPVTGRVGNIVVDEASVYWTNVEYGTVQRLDQ